MSVQHGKLIVIDGADGSGKATQTKLIVDRLIREKIPTETLDFPQYTKNTFGKLIRECQDGGHGDFLALDPYIASTLYASDRFEAKETLDTWLTEGKVIILDRYVSANMLHQGAKIADEKELTSFLTWIDHIEHYVFKVPRPAVIVYLDVPYDERSLLMRDKETKDAKKKMDIYEMDEKHQREVEDRARQIIRARNEWRSVLCTKDGVLRTPEEIHEDVYSIVKEYIV